MRGSRKSVAGVIVTALVVVPSAAVVCAFSCAETSGSHPLTASAAHAHHASSQHAAAPGFSSDVSRHDCRDHDGTDTIGGTPPRPIKFGRWVHLTEDGASHVDHLTGSLNPDYIVSTHAPPGTATSAPVVLRI